MCVLSLFLSLFVLSLSLSKTHAFCSRGKVSSPDAVVAFFLSLSIQLIFDMRGIKSSWIISTMREKRIDVFPTDNKKREKKSKKSR